MARKSSDAVAKKLLLDARYKDRFIMIVRVREDEERVDVMLEAK